MKRFIAWLPFLIILAAASGAASAPAQSYLAPGPLFGMHTQEKIECSACHRPFAGVRNNTCLECHRDYGMERSPQSGLHRAVSGLCVECHAQHQSAGKAITDIDPAGVVHDRTGFSLADHSGQECGGCHGRPFSRFSGGGDKRCADCHRGPKTRPVVAGVRWPWSSGPVNTEGFNRHERSVGSECRSCHRGDGTDFSHTRASSEFFSGKHAVAACRECHQNDRYDRDPSACSDCHQAPKRHFSHDCRGCHKGNKSWSAGVGNHPRRIGEEHTVRSFPCKDCHPDGSSAVDCRKCHRSRHPTDDDDLKPGIRGGDDDHGRRRDLKSRKRESEDEEHEEHEEHEDDDD